jgi:tetratricopeptide repeat protein
MLRKLFGKSSSPADQTIELIKKGVSSFEEGNIDAAINYYNKAIEINPKVGIAYINRGYAYFNKGNLSQAIQDATKAIEINPESIDAYGVRGDAHLQSENYEQAIADYSKAIELSPKLGAAYRKRALAYHANGKLAQAVADFESYLPLAPNDPARMEAQSYIDYLNEHGAQDGDVDFSPRMPDVDSDMLTNELLTIAQDMAEIKREPKLVIITPGRLIKTSDPLPGRETIEPKFLSMLEEIAPSSNHWNILAIGMTEFRAFNASPHNSVPFLNLLHGFAQIGHAVILFEGHPSGLTQMCRNRDMIVVDSEMIPFLQTDWLEVAKSTMRQPNVLKVNRKGLTLKGTEIL